MCTGQRVESLDGLAGGVRLGDFLERQHGCEEGDFAIEIADGESDGADFGDGGLAAEADSMVFADRGAARNCVAAKEKRKRRMVKRRLAKVGRDKRFG